MKSWRYIAFACILTLFYTQVDALFPTPPNASYKDSIAHSGIHSVVWSRANRQNTPPLLPLHKDEPLRLSFDYLEDEPISPMYRIVHCDPDWQASDLFTGDYLKGFEENTFPTPTTSQGTVQVFQHYELSLPNSDVQFRISGNYIVQVFDAYHSNRLLFQRQFAIYDERCRLSLERIDALGIYRLSHQQIRAQVDVQKMGQLLDTRDLRLFVQQGWQHTSVQELPFEKWLSPTVLLYGRTDTGRFAAGVPWHVLDLQSLRVPGRGVRTITYRENAYHVEVLPDRFTLPGRTLDHAPTEKDLYGWSVIGYNSDRLAVERERARPLESEYAWVYFTLEGSEGFDITLELHDRTQPMIYHAERDAYETSIYLKQGVYNYRYCWGTNVVEGNSAETANEYYALLYYHAPGTRYWQLIATAACL